MIRVGCAGFSYRDWEGVVFPRPRPSGFDPLRYLAAYFDALELNTTFYAPAREEVAEAWIERVSAHRDFRFTAKLWRRFTHEREVPFDAKDVRRTRDALDLMMRAGRLGAVLVQFPWSFRRSDENEDWLHAVLDAFTGLPLVLEVRHASWLASEVLESLFERGVGIANIDQPRFRDSVGPASRATSSVGYVRIHGRNWREWFRAESSVSERYDYLYTAEQLEPWAQRAVEVAASPTVKDVYVVTNNHTAGKAVVNALMLRAQLQGAPVPAPRTLVAAFPEVLEGFAFPVDPDALEATSETPATL